MNNLAIAQAWCLFLLPLPLLVWWLAPSYRMRRGGLQVPFMPRLAAAAGDLPERRSVVAMGRPLRWLLLCFCWFCAILALARPQVVEPPLSREVPLRDLLLAVDLSGSMETPDFTNAAGEQVDRLSAVKEVLDGFLAGRSGDRVGLIFFGSAAFVQAPFTEDLEVLRQLLGEAQVRMAGPQTAFGDALGLAINVFERSAVEERVLIALTDGNDTASQVPPDKAAQIARDKGIVIHTVAVGDPSAAGEEALDQVTLRRVSASTGGVYAHAADRDQLESIYTRLEQIETRKVQTVSHRPRRDVYWWPLAAGLLASMAYFSLGLLRSVSPPGESSRRSAGLLAVSPLAPGMALSAFHFLRPEWLLLLVPAGFICWRLQRLVEGGRAWRGIIAPHLLGHLWRGEAGRAGIGPLHWVGLSWLLAILAIAGPSWRQQPSPFADDTPALAVVIKVSPSMESGDIAPSRLRRATQKLQDLLALRGKGKTALVAYAGSAHLVMPATADAGIINSFAGALAPSLMPLEGDVAAQALALADRALERAGGGSILWISDSVSAEQARLLEKWRSDSPTAVRLWPPLAAGPELDALRDNASAVHPDLVRLAADDSDIARLSAAARFAPLQAGSADARWAESGYWFTPLIIVLMLVFFRRGWLVPLTGPAA